MLNAIEPGSSVPIHRHQKTSETVVCLRGRLVEEYYDELTNLTDMDIVERLRRFKENEMRSCPMDIGGITPLYVYRMWGGTVPINEIKAAMVDVRRMM